MQEQIKEAHRFLGAMGLEVREHVRNVDINFTEVEIAKYKKLFGKFDIDGSGSISLNNLRHLLHQMGENLTDDQLRELIAEVDINKNSTIEEDEFLQVSKCPYDRCTVLKDIFCFFLYTLRRWCGVIQFLLRFISILSLLIGPKHICVNMFLR